MRAEIALPKVGDSAFEGIVGRWLKAVGDRGEEFEPVGEIEGDKAIVEMPSPPNAVLANIPVAPAHLLRAGPAAGGARPPEGRGAASADSPGSARPVIAGGARASPCRGPGRRRAQIHRRAYDTRLAHDPPWLHYCAGGRWSSAALPRGSPR